MSRPRLLDLFCGAGGAAVGYHRAGFDVVGVDILPQPHYPFRFVEADALDAVRSWIDGGHWFWEIGEVEAIHASPPCQAYTSMSNRWRGKGGKADRQPDLIGPTRDLLDQTGLPYVIENVPGARSLLHDPVRLIGEMFGLRIHRPRLFETSFPLLAIPAPPRQQDPVAVYGKQDGRRLWTRQDGSELRVASLELAREAMGIPWADWDGCREAIPPVYTEWLGWWLLQQLSNDEDEDDEEGDG